MALRAQRRAGPVPGRRGEPGQGGSTRRSGEEAGRQAAGLAAGAGDGTAAALRRTLDAGGGGGEAERQEGRGLAGRLDRRAGAAVRARQRNRSAQAHALRRGPGARGRGQGQGRGAGRAARASHGAGNGRRSGEQDRPHPGHDRRLLLSVEPAQPGDPGGAPAGFRHQAAELSCRARQGPAAQYHGERRADHAAADRRRPRPRAGLLDAEELRRGLRGHYHVAARAREFAQSRHRPSARRRHRGQCRKRASIVFAGSATEAQHLS